MTTIRLINQPLNQPTHNQSIKHGLSLSREANQEAHELTNHATENKTPSPAALSVVRELRQHGDRAIAACNTPKKEPSRAWDSKRLKSEFTSRDKSLIAGYKNSKSAGLSVHNKNGDRSIDRSIVVQKTLNPHPRHTCRFWKPNHREKKPFYSFFHVVYSANSSPQNVICRWLGAYRNNILPSYSSSPPDPNPPARSFAGIHSAT